MIEKRKFPRVDLRQKEARLFDHIGARARWSDGSDTKVLDVSHTGAALERAKVSTLVPGQDMALDLLIPNQPAIPVECKVVRVGDHVVGVKFIHMETASRLVLENYLENKLIGLGVRLVNPHYYSPGQDFTYWFHGPHGFNLFIWEKERQVQRLLFELGDHAVAFENGHFAEGGRSDNDVFADESWMRQRLLHGTARTEMCLEILSQVQESKELLTPVVDLLLKLPGRVSR